MSSFEKHSVDSVLVRQLKPGDWIQVEGKQAFCYADSEDMYPIFFGRMRWRKLTDAEVSEVQGSVPAPNGSKA